MIKLFLGTETVDLNVYAAQPEEFAAPEPTGGEYPVQKLWSVVPSDLHDFPQRDRKVVEGIWQAMLQNASALLTETAYLEQSRYLLETPLVKPTKWVKLYFKDDYTNPEERSLKLTPKVYGNTLEIFDTTQALTIEGRSSNECSRVGKTLPARYSHKLSWKLNLGVYIRPNQRALFSCGVGVFGTSGRLQSGVAVTLTDRGTYYAAQVLIKGTSPYAPAERVEVLPNIPKEESGEYSIKLRWASEEETLYVEGLGSPINFALPETEFEVSEWFLSGTRVNGDVELDRPFHISLMGGEWWAPLLPKDTKYIPYLQDKPTSLQGLMLERRDFEVERVEYPFIRFKTLEEGLPESLWAEYVGTRAYTIRDCFAAQIPIPLSLLNQEDGEEFRNLVAGLRVGLMHGPHSAALHIALSALSGIPVCLAEGVVVRSFDRQGRPALVIREDSGRERVYYFPEFVEPDYGEGDRVPFLAPLADVVEIKSFSDPDGFRIAELGQSIPAGDVEKYKKLLVKIPYEVRYRRVETDVGRLLETYLDKIIPLWVGIANVTILYLFRLEDRILLRDDELRFPFISMSFLEDLRDENPLVYGASPQYTYAQPGIFFGQKYSDENWEGTGEPGDTTPPHPRARFRDELTIIEQ